MCAWVRVPLCLTLPKAPSLGETFGVFICKDIAYKHPRDDVVSEVDAVLYSVAFDDLGLIETAGEALLKRYTASANGALLSMSLSTSLCADSLARAVTVLAGNLGHTGAGAYARGTEIGVIKKKGTQVDVVKVPMTRRRVSDDSVSASAR